MQPARQPVPLGTFAPHIVAFCLFLKTLLHILCRLNTNLFPVQLLDSLYKLSASHLISSNFSENKQGKGGIKSCLSVTPLFHAKQKPGIEPTTKRLA